MNESVERLKLTMKAWPVIAIATIGLCYLTQLVAGWVGVRLPEQENIEIVRRCLTRAGSSWQAFSVAAFLVLQIIVLLPAIEECLFRWLLVALPTRLLRGKAVRTLAILSSLLFSAAHYVFQPWPDTAFIALFFFGLAQCWLYRATDRLWCVIANHGLFNLTNLILLFIVPPQTPVSP